VSRTPSSEIDAEALVHATLTESARVKQAVADSLAASIAEAGGWIADAFRGGKKAWLFGNGGSASDAQHIAAEWTGKLGPDRPALPAIALTANTSDLTAIGNDYGFEHVFARLVEGCSWLFFSSCRASVTQIYVCLTRFWKSASATSTTAVLESSFSLRAR
jgi:hypothetical protein